MDTTSDRTVRLSVLAAAAGATAGHRPIPTKRKPTAARRTFAYDCTYGFDGGVGSLDLQTGTIRTFQNVPNYEPVVAGSPASSRLLLAADAGLEPMTLYAYDISSGTPVVVGVDDAIQNGYLGHVVMTPDGHDVLLTESGHSWVQDLSVP